MQRVLLSSVAALVVVGLLLFFMFREPAKNGVGQDPAGTEVVSPEGEGLEPEVVASEGDKASKEVVVEPTPEPDPVVEEEDDESLGPVALTGIVLDSKGVGVPDARVALMKIAEWQGHLSGVEQRFQDPFSALPTLRKEFAEIAAKAPSRTTNEKGEFKFRGLSSTEYRVFALHAEHLPSTSNWVLVDLDSEPAHIEIPLLAAHSIEGIVVDQKGEPVVGARVSCESSELSRTRGMGRLMHAVVSLADGSSLSALGSSESDDEGRFRLSSLKPILYDVAAHKDGWSRAVKPKVPAGSNKVTIVLGTGRQVQGVVVDHRGDPVPDAKVSLFQPVPNRKMLNNPMMMMAAEVDWYGDRTRTGYSDAEGSFVVRGLEDRFYELNIEADGFPLHKDKLRVDKEEVDLGQLELEEPLIIAGRVVDESNRPVAEAKVSLLELKSERFSPPGATTKTDENGEFLFDGLAEKSFDLRVVHDEFGSVDQKAVPTGTDDLKLTIAAGSVIKGVVLDAKSREPIVGATISSYAGQRRTVKTDEEGRFRMAGIPELTNQGGKTYIQVKAAGYARNGTQIAPGGEEEEFLLTPEKSFRGVVVDTSGRPVAGARIEFEVPGVPTIMFTIEDGYRPASLTNEDGEFEVPIMRQFMRMGGFVVASRGNQRGTHKLDISAEAQRFGGAEGVDYPEIRIELKEAIGIQGIVTDLDGQPIAGAQVSVSQKSNLQGEAAMFATMLPNMSGKNGYSDETGKFFVRGLEPGEYKVEAVAIGYAKKSIQDYQLIDGGGRLDIALDPGLIVSGRVVDSNGDPVARAEVVAFVEQELGRGDREGDFEEIMLQAGGMGLSSKTTDEDGRYEITHLPETKLRIVARKPKYSLAKHILDPGSRMPDLVLQALSQIHLTVVDGATGALIEEPVVSLFRVREENRNGWSPRDIHQRTFPASEGPIVLPDLEAGTYDIGARLKGYAWSREKITLRAGEDKEVQLAIFRGGIVRGRVVDEEGAPLSGAGASAQLQEHSSSNSWRFSAEHVTSDAEGHFEVSGLTEGKYNVYVSHGMYVRVDGNTPSVEFDAEGGEVDLGDIVMKGAGKIKGSIAGVPSGSDRGQVFVQFTRIETEGERSADGESGIDKPRARRARTIEAWVQGDGRFETQAIDPGQYRAAIVRRQPGGERETLAVDIEVNVRVLQSENVQIDWPGGQ